MRKEKKITITDDNRDRGKQFMVREMSAVEFLEWTTKAVWGMRKGSQELPDQSHGGLLAVAAAGMGIFSMMPPETALELQMELLDSVFVIPDSRHPELYQAMKGDQGLDYWIKEVQTLVRLTSEALDLNSNFSGHGETST